MLFRPKIHIVVIGRNPGICGTPCCFALGYESGFKVEHFLFSQIGSRHIRRCMGLFVEKVKKEEALVLFMVPNLWRRLRLGQALGYWASRCLLQEMDRSI